MKKKVLSLLLALLVILGSIPLSLFSAAAEGISSITDGGTENPDRPVVSIVPAETNDIKDEFGGVTAKPDASGYAHFTIKATGNVTDNITVYYATEDYSAVAAAGDYEAKSGSVVLSSNNTEVQISIYTKRSEYSITLHLDNEQGRIYRYRYISRSFKIKLTGISDNATLDEDAREVKCSLNADHSLEAVQFAGATVLLPYTYLGKYEVYNFLTSPTTCGSDETVSKTVALNFPASWAADYIDGGIDAKLYLALKEAHVDESWWNSSSGITVNFLDNVTIKIKGEFHNNEEFGWGPAFLYVKNGVTDGQDGVGDKYKDYYNENYESVEWDYFWGDWDLKKAGLIYNLTTSLNSKIVIRRKYSFGEPNEKSNDPGEYYIGLADGVLKKTSTVVSLTSHGGYSRKLTSGTASFRLEDIIAPKIETTTSGEYAIYHNFDTVTKGENLRIAIRFNEPVQVVGKSPFLIGKVNGEGNGYESDKYTIRFNYVGGSGTDTLYFESNYSGNYQINSITDIQFKYGENIKDFGGVANSFTPISNFVITDFNLDKRTPVITSALSDSKMKENDWVQSKEISITVSNISDQAVLYYSWTDETSAPTYENSVALTGVSVNGTQDVKIKGGGDGKKYLYLKVVTKYGQEQTNITLTSENPNTQATRVTRLGLYNFDNTAPTIDETKLLPKPKNEGSNMKTKKYSIPKPYDASSKEIELKMYYIDEDGNPQLFEKGSHVFTESDTSNFEFEFTAADIGISDKLTRREVTVFYTLKDQTGNFDEEVARHEVVFDTHELVEVQYAGPTNADVWGNYDGVDYVKSTDTLEEGYVFVYNGDVSSGDENRTCFSFAFTGIDYGGALFDKVVPFIHKNGENELWLDGEVYIEEYVENSLLSGLRIDFKAPMQEGYYDIYLGLYKGNENNEFEEGEPSLVSETYRVYVGSGKGKLDEEINKGTVLVNKVYQVPTSSYFYYMDKSGTIGTVKSETYTGVKLPATFSSKEKALEYVLFNEYRDVYAITLTQEFADELNAGNFAAQKAIGEETIASGGQVWIRYKSTTWDVSKTHAKNDWVFYYYGDTKDGDTENLEISRFSKLLSGTITSIAERITAQGKTVALTDYSIANNGMGNSLVDKRGVPYLNPAQIFAEDMRLEILNPNSNFVNSVTYTKDTAIYSSHIVLNGIDNYVIIGNTVIPSGIHLQYKRIDENNKEDATWTEVSYVEGQRFRDVLEGEGRYKIRELGTGGASEYKVYIDSEAPRLQISWKDKNGSIITQTLNSTSEKEFRARSLKLIQIEARECDKYSYVAFYNMSKELYAVYWMAEVPHPSVDIPDGNYYMVVADRSGNSYTMTVYINSSELKCNIQESENVKIKFTCDRKESQIQEFYVKRDGVLLEGKYSPEMEFTESGTYEFYVRDIYGNIYDPEEPYEFKRLYPEVDWKYRDESGFFVTYNEETESKYFDLKKISEGSFIISTSVELKFLIPDNYGYTFLGVAPGHTENSIDRVVTIKNTQAFQLKIYYKKHPEVYTIYNCSADTVAPVIDVSVPITSFKPDEVDDLRDAIKAGTAEISGSKLIPSRISYSSAESSNRNILNNEMVLADFIKVSAYDETGIASIKVYLDEKLIKEQSGDNVSDDIVLTKSGKYKIVAEDVLGNKSDFSFTNGTPNSFLYRVDGLPIKLELHNSENFDENGNYTDSVFGNESVAFEFYEHMKIFYMITGADGVKRFVAFDVNDNLVREVYYCLDGEGNLMLATSDTVLFNGNGSEVVKNKQYIIYEIKEIGLKIYAKVNTDGTVALSILTSDIATVTVEARLNTESEEFYYSKTELSTSLASVTFKTEEKTEKFEATKNLIKFNKAFTILTDNFETDKITAVEVYYSNKNDFEGYNYLFKDEIYKEGAYYEKEGFYFVRLLNEYNNESIFLVHLSNKFDVTAYSEFADGTKNYYSADHAATLYSNSKVVFELFVENPTVSVQKGGVGYQPVITVNNGITYVILSESGKYEVSLSDACGNTITRKAEIDSSTITFNEGLLTGYNENALKKSEGYTNQKLSVNKAVFAQEKISYLAVQYGDVTTVIYDGISELGTALDESKLVELIGNQGDGQYILQLRNRYGALLTKVIHYRGTPTFTLERVIRSSVNPEAYDISKALSIGFWSNNELIFKTEAETYEFTVNGDKTECPKTLTFASADQQSRSEYEITYVDEYGFKYSFKAYLVRQEVEVNTELTVDGVNIDGILTTVGDIFVRFPEDANCTYTLNNSEEKSYTPGEKLTRDGLYRFVVVDYAGNTATVTVKKDTIVEFEFVESNTSAVVQNGGVVNVSKVEFKSVNGDTVFIEKAFKNGVLQSDVGRTKFSEDGKWEFVVSDKLGNKAYYCFYIVTKQKSNFAYTTPYEYQITELWYDSGDGVKISYLMFVNHSETSSSFEFSENGKYTVVMTSTVTGSVSKFEFTINTTPPAAYLVGCNPGDTTLNDVTVAGYVIGDTIKVYRITSNGEELVSVTQVTSLTTKIPVVNEGGEYRIVVESEAGVETSLSFVRKHVMNTEGSIFIIVVIAVAVIGLFVGLVYRNKSKTDK